MNNPWEDISLCDYENHMRLDTVMQLQTLNSTMKKQFEAYDVDTAMVLGVAGGNGLEHINSSKYTKVYGIDINKNYLNEVSKRYRELKDVLELLHIDLLKESDKLPKASLVIANLLIEYIGYSSFQTIIRQVKPKYVSCVIQINTDKLQWVSDSKYIHAFDRLDEIHNQMSEEDLTNAMQKIGYSLIAKEVGKLPNGKALLRLDYA